MKKCILILIAVVGCSVLNAQEILSTTGENSRVEGCQVCWTLGELVIETSGQDNVLTQGFHQTKLIVTSSTELQLSGIELKVYPNPTADFVTVQLKQLVNEIGCTVYNNQGRMLKQQQINTQQTKLDFTNFASGHYILRISGKNGKTIQSFNVIKR